MTTGTKTSNSVLASEYANPKLWIGAIDRMIASAGQTAVVFLTAGISGIFEVNGPQMLSVVLLAVAASLATSLAYPKRVIAGEDTGQTAHVVEEYLQEQFHDGQISSRDSQKRTQFVMVPLEKEDGSWLTRRELREMREQTEPNEVLVTGQTPVIVAKETKHGIQ